MGKQKLCPMKAGKVLLPVCTEEECQWWRKYANDCAIGVLVDILADSTICQNSWQPEAEPEPLATYDPDCVF